LPHQGDKGKKMNRRKQILKEFGKIEGLKRLTPKPKRKYDPIGEGAREGLAMLRKASQFKPSNNS